MSGLRVLIGCETSGIGRRAFARRWPDADVWSCDIEPAEDGSNRHIICDICDGILTWGWDLLAVMHPPCTRLCRSGRRWMSGPGKWTPPKQLPRGRSWADMRAEFDLGVHVFSTCWEAPVARVAIENPEMNDLARDRMSPDLPAPQMVQPHWFGDPAYKGTGWYLRNLPPLVPTGTLDGSTARDEIHRAPPGPHRKADRSRFFPGLASAMAAQWGGYAAERVAA